jgi:hypothetical protein
MIFNDEILFIHNGKTGGTSCAAYLLECLPDPVYVCRADAHWYCAQHPGKKLIPVTGVNQHCPLFGAPKHLQLAAGVGISDFRKILIVIRHPLSLEYSFYLHMQKPQVRERRKNNPELLRLADGCFSEFIRGAGYHREGLPQEAFFLVDGVIPPNVELIRFETLAQSFSKAVQPYSKPGHVVAFPHANASQISTPLSELLTDEIRELTYAKHRYMFESGLYDINQLV